MRHWYQVEFPRRTLDNKVQEWAFQEKRARVVGSLLEIPSICLGFLLTKPVQSTEVFTDLSTVNLKPEVFLVVDYVAITKYEITSNRGFPSFAYLILYKEQLCVVDETDLKTALENDTRNNQRKNP